MHVHFLDPYKARSSPVHALDARVKLPLTLAAIVTISLMPVGAWPIYILLFAIILSVVIVSELGVFPVLRRASLAFPFVLAALPILFNGEGDPLFSLWPGGLSVYGPGLERFLSIGFKSWLSVQVAIVLASSTPFPDLLMALRALRVPRLLVAVFGLMWRYLFVMADEALRLMRAREARSGAGAVGGKRVGGTVAWRARVTGGMAGNLFVRSLERGDRIYSAMVSRGYDGEVRALPRPGIPPAHWVVFGLGLALLLALLALALIL